MLIDNITGTFSSPAFASMVTSKYLTGMAPYGHGEEKRLNNLTYVITCNTGHIDNDLIDRCLYVHVKKPTSEQKNGWSEKVSAYISKYRLNIISDIIDMLKKHTPTDLPKLSVKGDIRFVEFANRVLAPSCGDPDTFLAVLNHTVGARCESNSDEDMARCIKEEFDNQLTMLDIDLAAPVYITTSVCNSWARKGIQSSGKEYKSDPIQLVRNLSKNGMLKEVDAEVRRWPMSSSKERHSGIAWNFTESTESAVIICRDSDGKCYKKFA